MHRWLPAILLVLLLAGFRVLGALFPQELSNWQPLPALLLCSLVFLKGPARWILPLSVWVVTDPIVSAIQGYPLIGWHHIGIAAGLAATVAIGLRLRHRPGYLHVLLGAAGAAVAFYFLSNTVTFLASSLYPKSLDGFVQAQWSGPSGYGPTWVFLRNSLAANILFTAIFLAARQSLPKPFPQPAEAFSR